MFYKKKGHIAMGIITNNNGVYPVIKSSTDKSLTLHKENQKR